MSHFSVLVIGDDVEKQLTPYQENNMGTCPPKYMEFNDVEDECRKEYEEKVVEMVELPSGKRVFPWDDMFRSLDPLKSPSAPEHLPRVNVPVKELYPTFDEFCTDWSGYKKDPKIGRYGYWENPNAKWDWWVVGGRYSGKLKLKPGTQGETGRRSWTNEKEEIRPEFVDSARFADIDWEGMREHRLAERAKWWDEAESKGENETMRRLIYGIEPEMTKEQYIAKGEEFSVFAVLKDGQWYEKGEMGWFAIVSNEKEETAWKSELKSLIEGLSPDTRLTIVDCHI